jgi:hypothetical protein
MTTEADAVLDRSRITDVVIRFANAFDTQNWKCLRSCLADQVWTDDLAFRREKPGLVAADTYVAGRQSGLQGLVTMHVSTNHHVSVDGDKATCLSDYRIYRIDPARPTGDTRLDTAGSYEHGLVRVDGRWLINRIRQTVRRQSGSAEVRGALRRQAVG